MIASRPNAGVILRTSGTCDTTLTRLSDCSAAAAVLGFLDQTAADDGQSRVDYDPPGCYYEADELKFNAAMDNLGNCSPSDQCLCGQYRGGGACDSPASVRI